jgi:hypothetical protein
MAPTGIAGDAGHGLPSGQIVTLYFALATTFDANETPVVAVKITIDTAPTSNVFVEQIRRADIVSPRFKTDETFPPLWHVNAYLHPT